MDSLVAEVKRLFEEADSEITVVETLPRPHPATDAKAEIESPSGRADADPK